MQVAPAAKALRVYPSKGSSTPSAVSFASAGVLGDTMISEVLGETSVAPVRGMAETGAGCSGLQARAGQGVSQAEKATAASPRHGNARFVAAPLERPTLAQIAGRIHRLGAGARTPGAGEILR
jgi:hypothetical protein